MSATVPLPWFDRPSIRAATHASPHHLDELVALVLLTIHCEEKGRTVERHFLDRAAIEQRAGEFDVLIDIGLEYDPVRGQFDHHQGGPAVEGRSAAGLVFECLYAGDPRHDLLAPAIAVVDRIDNGQPVFPGPPVPGAAAVSLSSLLKALGGFRPDPAASQRCYEVIEALVRHWLARAADTLRASTIVAAGQPVGAGLFLDNDAGLGGVLQYLQTTFYAFVGVPRADGFQVSAVADTDGRDRVRFPPDLPGARFVHPRGFLAVFPDRETAAATLAAFHPGSGS